MSWSISSCSISLSTSADPTTAADQLFRLAPPQTLQTPVLANLAGERDVSIVCVVHSDDPAGQAMAGAFKVAFEQKGGAVRRTVTLGEGDTAELLDGCIGS